MFLGLTLSTVWVAFDLKSMIGTIMYLIGSILMGAGAAAMFMELILGYGKLGVRVILSHGTVAMLIATCYQLIIAVFHLQFFNMLVNPWFPVIMYACLRKESKRIANIRVAEGDGSQPQSTPYKLFATTFVQGLAFGIGLGILLLWEDQFVEPRVIGSLCAGAAALLLLITAVKLKASFTSMIYLVGLPLIAIGFLIMAYSEHLIAVGNAMQALGSCYLYIVMASLFVYLAKTLSIPLERACGIGMASLFAGQALGGCLGSALISSMIPIFSLSSLACTMSVLLLLLSLFISNSGLVYKGWESASPGALDADGFTMKVKIVSAEAGLTPRESDILQLAAHGRNKSVISRELSISEETAKTHLRNIYQKLGVHSHQELIDLMESGDLRP